MNFHFIPSELVPVIHADLIKRYGGSFGIRVCHLLESALAQPKMMFGGKFAHKTIYDKAAAYGFHLCRNHPFIDGNKRTAFVIMNMFLMKNGLEIYTSEQEVYSMMMKLADGRFSKTQLSALLKVLCVKIE